MESYKLTWLHLSDLHFGHGGKRYGLDQRMICRAILEDAGKVAADLGPPDWILVTGDIAFKGAPEEYRQASAWLEELAGAVGVAREHVLLVPGNHDVDRGLATGKLRPCRAHEYLRAHPVELDEYLADPDAFGDLWAKLAAYADFAKDFGPVGVAVSEGQPWWLHECTSPVGEIALIGLNTVLASFGDHEQGLLPLGNRQLLAIQEVPPKRLLILLQHHPHDWLQDGYDELAWLGHRPHLLLCGHVHRQSGLLSLPLDGQGHLTLVAGAGHSDPKDPPDHAYSWGRLSRSGLEYLPRLWIDHHKQFRADKNRFDSMDEKGVVRIQVERLPDPLQTWLAGLPPTVSSGEPAWLKDLDPAFRDSVEGYLRKLRAACNQLPIRMIDPKLDFGEATYTLPAIYCDLSAAAPREPGSGQDLDKQTGNGEEHSVEDLISRPENRFALLGGDLGSGKSTIVRWLARQLSGAGTALGLPLGLTGRVPVLVSLGEALDAIAAAPNGDSGLIWELVQAVWQATSRNTSAPAQFLRDATRHPHVQGIQQTNVFLSHNSQDKPAVRELAVALRKRDLHVWLDEDELRPGIPWQRPLEDGIRASDSVAVLIGKDGLGPWEDEEMQAALQLAVKDKRSVIPVILPDAPEPPELPLFLSNRTWVDLRPALSEAGLARLVWGITGDKPKQSLGGEEDGLHPFLRRDGIFLLDGLDEVPETEAKPHRGRLLAALAAFADELADEPGGEARILVTARPYALPAELPRFRRLDLQPMSQAQIRQFIGSWYRAAGAARSWPEEKTDRRTRALIEAIEERPFLQDLAARPLLLTLVAGFHDRFQGLPKDRAALLESAVDLLLSRWHAEPDRTGRQREPELPSGCLNALREGRDRIRSGLEDLAYRLHKGEQSSSSGEAGAGLSRAEVIGWFGEWVPDDCHPGTLIEHLEQRSGILVPRPDGTGWTFPHRAFREYLAACHLANSDDPARELLDRVDQAPEWWREVFLLTIGKMSQGGTAGARNLLSYLLQGIKDECDRDWRIVYLCALAARELGLDQIKEEQRLTDLAQNQLTRLVVEGRLPPAERAEAGDLLGIFAGGDPREGIGLGPDGLPDIKWEYLNGGRIEVGAGPVARPASVKPFQIARYPVTVAQFESFVAAGGYAEQGYWTSLGWAWRNNARREAPADWPAQKPFPNRPVTGVTWYEAIAFCHWLSGVLGFHIDLPTEEQWECAARGTRRRTYPWADGAEWDGQRANCGESGIGHPTTVGMYPLGCSPEGVDDLAGNTWEWTCSLHEDDTQRPSRHRDDPDQRGARSVRGGSWWAGVEDLRAAHRRPREPASDDPDLGFRPVTVARS